LNCISFDQPIKPVIHVINSRNFIKNKLKNSIKKIFNLKRIKKNQHESTFQSHDIGYIWDRDNPIKKIL